MEGKIFASTKTLSLKLERAMSTFREESALHISRMVCWQRFNSTQSHGDVIEQLNTAREQHLKRIAAVTTFLGKRGIPFRKHGEQDTSHSPGNFL